MSPLGSKLTRLRLDPDLYEQLRNQVLRRDGWRCQSCGTMSNLEVHHKEFRSHSGDDCEQNLITVCAECNANLHGRGVDSSSQAPIVHSLNLLTCQRSSSPLGLTCHRWHQVREIVVCLPLRFQNRLRRFRTWWTSSRNRPNVCRC